MRIRPYRSGDRLIVKRNTRKQRFRRGPVRPLRSELDYSAALLEIEHYFNHEPKLGTAAADGFDLLALLIEDYEDRHWLIGPPNPIEASTGLKS